jgi:hypothetical protein
MALTVEQQASIIEGYVNNVIDNLDVKDMESLLYDLLSEGLQDQTETELKELIVAVYDEEFYQNLLAEVIS